MRPLGCEKVEEAVSSSFEILARFSFPLQKSKMEGTTALTTVIFGGLCYGQGPGAYDVYNAKMQKKEEEEEERGAG